MGYLYSKLNDLVVDRYGLGNTIREYGFYPKKFPICVPAEHGVSLKTFCIPELLRKPQPFYLYNSKHKDEKVAYKKIKIRYPSPFIWYRHKNKIVKNANAKGSIFFLAHSTSLVKAKTELELLLKQLDQLPEHFKPITFCVHFNDIDSDSANRLRHKGFEVIYLSKSYTDNQLSQFYKVIVHYRFFLCNLHTSGLFYACELGLPCSVIGLESVEINNYGNEDRPIGIQKSNSNPYVDKVHSTFYGVNEKISQEQWELMKYHTSLELIGSLSNRLSVSFALYFSLIVSVFYNVKAMIKSIVTK